MAQQLSLDDLFFDEMPRPTSSEPESSKAISLEQMERDVQAMERAEREQPVKPWLTRPHGEPPSALLRTILNTRRAAHARMERLEARKRRWAATHRPELL